MKSDMISGRLLPTVLTVSLVVAVGSQMPTLMRHKHDQNAPVQVAKEKHEHVKQPPVEPEVPAQTIRGIVYFIALRNSELLDGAPKSNYGYLAGVRLQENRLQGKQILSDAEARKLELGQIWETVCKEDQLQSYKIVGLNKDINDANHAVLNFYKKLALKDDKAAFNCLSADYAKKRFGANKNLFDGFENDYGNLLYVDGNRAFLDRSLAPLSPYGASEPPIQSTKIQKITPGGIRILVDERFFYRTPPEKGYEVLTVKKTGGDSASSWKIENIEPATDQDWILGSERGD